ncbi:MAG: hypothetical protein PHR77_13275 [Kiritimatiellae bacterium]|nr:hypothetical protein [Kiritimatiellia bacterium]MDD5520484.1 hypothetical protein [Kiritimatiellia bacterium]
MFYVIINFICISITPVIWIIAESALLMYRFPFNTSKATGLVAGFYLQLVVICLTGNSLPFAMFVAVYTTLLAIFACLLPAIVKVYRRFDTIQVPVPHSCVFPLYLLVSFLVLVPPISLFPILRVEFIKMSTIEMIASSLVILANTISTIRSLMDLSVFGRPDPEEQKYSADWERWAAPTVILMILSVVTGIVIAGIRRSQLSV